tara:strand:+ start:471 stop:1619 length:1149 start_codon:yes stop_codon:yes gene_type:complete
MSFTKKQIAFIKAATEEHGAGAELNRDQLKKIAKSTLGRVSIPGWIKTPQYRVAKGVYKIPTLDELKSGSKEPDAVKSLEKIIEDELAELEDIDMEKAAGGVNSDEQKMIEKLEEGKDDEGGEHTFMFIGLTMSQDEKVLNVFGEGVDQMMGVQRESVLPFAGMTINNEARKSYAGKKGYEKLIKTVKGMYESGKMPDVLSEDQSKYLQKLLQCLWIKEPDIHGSGVLDPKSKVWGDVEASLDEMPIMAGDGEDFALTYQITFQSDKAFSDIYFLLLNDRGYLVEAARHLYQNDEEAEEKDLGFIYIDNKKRIWMAMGTLTLTEEDYFKETDIRYKNPCLYLLSDGDKYDLFEKANAFDSRYVLTDKGITTDTAFMSEQEDD